MNHLRIILLYMPLGMIVNVAVAWSVAAWNAIDYTTTEHAFFESRGPGEAVFWRLSRKKEFGVTQVVSAIWSGPVDGEKLSSGFLPVWSDLEQHMNNAIADARDIHEDSADLMYRITPHIIQQNAFGWPLRSLYWHWDIDIRIKGPKRVGPNSHRLWIPQRQPGQTFVDGARALPLGILPLGFAINTLLMVLLLWLAFSSAINPLVRWNRMRRGLCKMCRYDLRGAAHEACPECGAEIMKATSA